MAASYDRDEVEAAFRHYFLTGPVGEDWARPPAGHQPSPCWLGQAVPPITRLSNIDVGTRHPVAASARRP
jgi:hypothetical protein